MAERTESLFVRRTRGGRQLTRISLASLSPNPAQPRRIFSENALQELASSIRRYGLLSPLIVRRTGPDSYELIAGERRLRALRMLGEEESDAIVLTATDRESALMALIENLQREDLDFFEEAEAYQTLLAEHGLTREELACRLSRSPSAVANRLRLLKLPPSVRSAVAAGGLTERHARTLLRLNSETDQLDAADKAIRMQLNVRSFEQLVDRMLRSHACSRQTVRGVYRDHRMFVNAMMNTVRSLQSSGVGVTSRVVDRADGVEITVIIPRILSGPAMEAQKKERTT